MFVQEPLPPPTGMVSEKQLTGEFWALSQNTKCNEPTETPTGTTRRERPLRSQLSHSRWHQQGSDVSLLSWAVNQESVIRYLTNNSYDCCAHTHTLNRVPEFQSLPLSLQLSQWHHKASSVLKDRPSACSRTRFWHCCASETFKVTHWGRDPWGQIITPRLLKQMRAVIFLAHCYQINLSPAGFTASICPTCVW